MWLRRTLFTAVFTLFLLIFFTMLRYATGYWAPHWLEAPVDVTPEYFLRLLGLFSMLVLVSFWGASSVVFGNLRGTDREPSARHARGPRR